MSPRLARFAKLVNMLPNHRDGFVTRHSAASNLVRLVALDLGLVQLGRGAYARTFMDPNDESTVARVSGGPSDGHRHYAQWVTRAQNRLDWMPVIHRYLGGSGLHVCSMERLWRQRTHGNLPDAVHKRVLAAMPGGFRMDVHRGNIMVREDCTTWVLTDPWSHVE